MKIHKIELPTPFPVGNVNVWFIEDSVPTLIDAGVHSSKSYEVLNSKLAQLGFRTEDIKRIILTHHHTDHSGAAAELSAMYGSEIFLSPRCNAQLSDVNAHRQHYRNYVERCGVPAEILDLFRESNQRWSEFASEWSKAGSLHILHDGEYIDFDNVRLQCVFTPGHSQDHVCFTESEGRFVFSGDHLLAGITPNPLIFFDPENGMTRSRSLLNYLDSLTKLENIHAEIAYGGHGADIDDPQSVINKNRRLVEVRCKSFDTLIRSEGEMSVYEMALKHFGRLHPLEVYLAVSETVAYIDLLVRRGQAVFDESGERLRVVAV